MLLSKNSLCDKSRLYALYAGKGFLRVNDTGTCDISFSLASNSHGSFYIKFAFG